tara:strand:+ start:1133 stop:1402 length:270 start_codon:yes stop_codon:yes gene_type:complete
MKNRALKISVSVPLKLVEEVDKKTTYKGRSRSKWITNAIKSKLNDIENAPEMTERQLTAMLLYQTKDPLLKAILQVKLNPDWYEQITQS